MAITRNQLVGVGLFGLCSTLYMTLGPAAVPVVNALLISGFLSFLTIGVIDMANTLSGWGFFGPGLWGNPFPARRVVVHPAPARVIIPPAHAPVVIPPVVPGHVVHHHQHHVGGQFRPAPAPMPSHPAAPVHREVRHVRGEFRPAAGHGPILPGYQNHQHAHAGGMHGHHGHHGQSTITRVGGHFVPRPRH